MARDSSNLAVTIAGTGVLVVVIGAIWFGLGKETSLPSPPLRTEVEDLAAQVIRVHVSGAVGAPSVVQLPVDAIVADAVAAAGGAIASADLTAINLAAPVRAGERIVVPDRDASAGSPSEIRDQGIDVNDASALELEGLPGVGPVLANRIVAFRIERGPFRAIEDLLDVPGIGEAKLLQMRELLANL